MAGNTFGTLFKITTFGESHGEAIGVIVDGCPAGLLIDTGFIQQELNRRKPGQSEITSPRNENDEIELLSGVFENKSTGAPIMMMVRNTNQKPQDYSQLKDVYRPSHADYTWETKYGIRDYRGGGRSSARETAARVMGGAMAKLLLAHHDISIHAFVSQVHHIKLTKHYHNLDLSLAEKNLVRCPDADTAQQMIELIEQVKQQGDTVGGAISCVIKGVPAGIGEPVFDKLNAQLAKAIMSINACKGFETGNGFDALLMKGSEHNDAFENQNGQITTKTNHSGGIQGGISNGNDIFFRCAFKPVSSIKTNQQTLNTAGASVNLKIEGRHDPCVVPRAVPIVEAMAALVVADQLLMNRLSKL